MPDSIKNASLTYEEKSFDSSSDDQAYESVFVMEYQPRTKSASLTVAQSGYFLTDGDMASDGVFKSFLSDETDNYRSSMVPATSHGSNTNPVFWQIIVETLSETHEEKYSLHNTLSDSVAVFATGAKPISIQISGKLLHSRSDDHYFLFLQNYVNRFRARLLTTQQRTLTFISQDTVMNVIITNMTLNHGVDLETYSEITISGYAYGYKQNTSVEDFVLPNDLTYYGTNYAIPVKSFADGETPEGNDSLNLAPGGDNEVDKQKTTAPNNTINNTQAPKEEAKAPAQEKSQEKDRLEMMSSHKPTTQTSKNDEQNLSMPWMFY